MKNKAIIAGNHLIDTEKIVLETKALHHGLSLHTEESDFILVFDHYKLQLPDLIQGRNSFPLTRLELFTRKEELPNLLPADTRMIFENSLRNYARRMYEKKETHLSRDMYKNNCDSIACNCLGMLVSLLEILYISYSYEEIIWVEEKLSQRIKIHDLLKANLIFPNLKIVWI